jgi:hypothetical protein
VTDAVGSHFASLCQSATSLIEASRIFGGVQRYRLDWVGMGYSSPRHWHPFPSRFQWLRVEATLPCLATNASTRPLS